MSTTPKACSRCLSPVYSLMLWPGGYICRPCHRRATTAEDRCPRCGAVGLTPGPRFADGYLCRTCSDPPEMGAALCRCCGSQPRAFSEARCWKCRLRQVLDDVLDDGSGQVKTELRPLADTLAATLSPEAVLAWLAQPPVKPNLRLLASGTVPLSHAGLNGLEPWRSVAYLRDLLMECGTLPRVDRYLIQHERWLANFLAAQPDQGRRKILERFATWHLLRQLRAEAARRPLVRERTDHDRSVLRRAAEFLNWLAADDLQLDTCRQADLDRWVAQHSSRAYLIRHTWVFLHWCMQQRLMKHLALVPPRTENPAPISQDTRLALIRNLLAREHCPLVGRVVALLVLLYAQPVARIARLRAEDVLLQGGEVSLRLGDPPSSVPEPFAALLLGLLANRPSMSTATNQDSPWLLPGRRAGQPMTPGTLRKLILGAGVPNVYARTSALRQLVLQMPASVVAGMLGFHPVHTAFVTKQAGADWSRYAPGDHSRNLAKQRRNP